MGSFLGLWGQEKSPKISTNAYRMKLDLRQLNSMGDTQLNLDINLEHGTCCKKIVWFILPFSFFIWKMNKDMKFENEL